MTKWILTAKQDVKSRIPVQNAREKYGKTFRKGQTLIVHAPCTGGPDYKDVIGALLLDGYCQEDAEHINGGSWTNNFDGYDTKEDYDNEIFSKQFEAQLTRSNYSWKKLAEADKKNEAKETESKSNDSSNDDDNECCGKFIRFIIQLIFTVIPILPIWWIIKLFMFNIWYCIKAIGYIISWPIRLLCCCCSSTRFIPEWDNCPEYWFNTK